jgi:hypothetical protein
VAWPVDVGGIERRHVVVHAKLPVPGTYVSHLGLVVGTERIADVSLTVQRLRPATHVSVAEIDPVAGTTCGCRGSRPVKLRFAVTETEARPAVVPEPVLSRLVRVERDGSVTQVPDVTARLVPVDGAAWPATLEPASTRVGELELQGLCRAGRHSGTLSFRAGESLPVEKAFTVSIREPAAVALLLLLVGAILGELLRWWVSVGRSRALRAGIVLRQLAALRNLDTAGWTAGSTALVARLEDLLWDLHGRVRSASAAVSEDVLNLLEHKVRVLPLRERAARLEAATGRADLAGALRAIDEVVLDEAATSGRLQEAERDLEQAVGVAGFESRGRLAPATRGDPADILRALHRRIRLADLLVGACVFVVVGMLGLKATWLSDGAWGGIVDHVEALLWGLGLQHFGYTGVTAFRDRLIR